MHRAVRIEVGVLRHGRDDDPPLLRLDDAVAQQCRPSSCAAACRRSCPGRTPGPSCLHSWRQ
jgi:hypothetical protein